MPLPPTFLKCLEGLVGEQRLITSGSQLERHSADYHWFSPVLKEQLAGSVADAVVLAQSRDELIQIVALAAAHRVPVTPRGTGTGNYGQAVPVEGGLVLGLQKLDRIIAIEDGWARVEPGVKLAILERQARANGQELRFYPSTYATASAGGFLAGGAGGIGSITHGTLWDPGNVIEVTLLTMEEQPREITLTGHDDLLQVIHALGLNGILLDVTFALAPRHDYSQFTVAFDDFDDALAFGEAVAYDEAMIKRLVSLVEWPIPGSFRQLVREGAAPEGHHLILLEADHSPDAIQALAQHHRGEVTLHITPERYQRGLALSDFSWNHTTLWAIKADDSLTYIQDAFDRDRIREQIAARRERFGDDLLHHIEFMRAGGVVYPQGMSLVRYRSPAQLAEITAFCESIGMILADPHTRFLDEDARWNGTPILEAKRRWDPHGLLNPGKLRNPGAAHGANARAGILHDH